MSVPYLLNENGRSLPASERIPEIARPFVSKRAAELLDVVSTYLVMVYFCFDPI